MCVGVVIMVFKVVFFLVVFLVVVFVVVEVYEEKLDRFLFKIILYNIVSRDVSFKLVNFGKYVYDIVVGKGD